MRSMTGFGAGSAPLGNGRVLIEIRSLNHKHQDLRLRIPTDLAEHGSFLEQLARKRLGRGRYDMSVRLEGRVGSPPRVDTARLRSLYSSLCELRDEMAPEAPLDIASLLALPDIVTTEGPKSDESKAALSEAFSFAESQLNEMREAEGQSLKKDLEERLILARSLKKQILDASGDLVLHHRTRLQERITALLDGTSQLSPSRLEQEVALVADRSDITEELVRLESHFDRLSLLLDSSEATGRRIDFLLQEVGREVNTIGSKSQHSQLAHLVVDIKSEVERLREQVQNVE